MSVSEVRIERDGNSPEIHLTIYDDRMILEQDGAKIEMTLKQIKGFKIAEHFDGPDIIVE